MKTMIASMALTVLLMNAGRLHAAEEAAIAPTASRIPVSAQDINPLLIGSTVPTLTLQTADGKPFDLNAAVAKKPAVVIFYRGGHVVYTQRAFLFQEFNDLDARLDSEYLKQISMGFVHGSLIKQLLTY